MVLHTPPEQPILWRPRQQLTPVPEALQALVRPVLLVHEDVVVQVVVAKVVEEQPNCRFVVGCGANLPSPCTPGRRALAPGKLAELVLAAIGP